ncbi:hypothetical protein DPMN_096584 [Dreissena polymorpha]|uniref:Uncharacterized protein n=1 Tax=Dreissena polymorpha TaxID=45954 RepID=A0A9D4L8L8_DREPO|nr:hypothetical protein DPMN_096584 [Dreissena polymorpha]
MKDAKNEWIQVKCIKNDKKMTTGSSKNADKTLKILTQISKPNAGVIANAEGNLHTKSALTVGRNTEATSITSSFNQTPSLLQNDHRRQKFFHT